MTFTTTLSPPISITQSIDDIFPVSSELTIAQAATILGIPKPDLIELLDSGEIESCTFGNRRMVSAASIYDYNRETARLQDEALDELTQQAQELGVY